MSQIYFAVLGFFVLFSILLTLLDYLMTFGDAQVWQHFVDAFIDLAWIAVKFGLVALAYVHVRNMADGYDERFDESSWRQWLAATGVPAAVAGTVIGWAALKGEHRMVAEAIAETARNGDMFLNYAAYFFRFMQLIAPSVVIALMAMVFCLCGIPRLLQTHT